MSSSELRPRSPRTFFGAVSPAFNDLVEHDVHWGSWNVEGAYLVDSPYMQSVLSLGLEKLYHIAEAETYRERHRLLQAKKPPPFIFAFLYEGLRDANEPNYYLFLNELTQEQERVHIKAPFFEDSDSGPADCWRWAHIEESLSNLMYQEDRQGLREWGYVMWDRSRLDAIGVFREPWEEWNMRDAVSKQREADRQQVHMQISWTLRESVAQLGGSGWWSGGDQSQVKWPAGQAPRRDQGSSTPRVFQPGSLPEAREWLRWMTSFSSVKG